MTYDIDDDTRALSMTLRPYMTLAVMTVLINVAEPPHFYGSGNGILSSEKVNFLNKYFLVIFIIIN